MTRGSSAQKSSAGWSSGDEAAPMFKPLRILGDAVKEKLAVLSASTRATSCRSGDDEGLYGEFNHNDEEARGLLHGGDRSAGEDDEEELFVPPQQAGRRLQSSPPAGRWSSSPSRRKGPVDSSSDVDSEDEEAALNAVMKLRPSVRDSLGNDDTDDEEGSARPLIGTDRASLLSR